MIALCEGLRSWLSLGDLHVWALDTLLSTTSRMQ